MEADLDAFEQLKFEVLHEAGGLPQLHRTVQAMKDKEASGGELSCHGIFLICA